MASLVKGGNVNGGVSSTTSAAVSKARMQSIMSAYYSGSVPTPAFTKDRPTRATWLMLTGTILLLTIFVISTVVAGLSAQAHNVYVEVNPTPATTYTGYFKNINPVQGFFLPLLLTSLTTGLGFLIMLPLTIHLHGEKFGSIGEWIYEYNPLVIFINTFVIMGVFIAVFMSISTSGQDVNTDMMNERANNWITEHLHIPTVMNYAENAGSNTKYAEYNDNHKMIHFTIQSSLSSIKVIPTK